MLRQMTQHVDNIIIGFGKAGKTLAQFLGERGEQTLLIEKSPEMYGGTCINIGCIPTKKLVEQVSKRPDNNTDKYSYYTDAIKQKKALRDKMNPVNYQLVANTKNVEIIDGLAQFVDNHTISVTLNDGSTAIYTSDRIYINTGSTPSPLPIKGLEVGGRIHNSTTLLDLETLPDTLTILGGGPIGLEFASIYADFGSTVTVLEYASRDDFLGFVDTDIKEAVIERLTDRGIQLVWDVRTDHVTQNQQGVIIHYSVHNEASTVETDALLVAAGRKPLTDNLGLEHTDIKVGDRGEIKVSDTLETAVPGVFALGDVKGGPQFTYISLDDFRVIKNNLLSPNSSSIKNRQFPTTTFINPPLSHVGLTEHQAKDRGHSVDVKTLPVAKIPKAMISGKTTGLFKVIIDTDSNHILGATLYGEASHELINLFTTAIQAQLDYRILRDQIYTHPTMAESLNMLLG